MPDEHISDMLAERALLDLQDAFSGASGQEAVGEFLIGRLQDNPVNEKLIVAVHLGDPDDPAWSDGTFAQRDNALDRSMFQAVAFEVGGGGSWWRRFSVTAGLYGQKPKLARDEARRIGNLTRAKIERAIAQSSRLRGFTDSLGEVAIKPVVVSSQAIEGGGPPANYIWRCKVRFQVLTDRPF